MRRYAVSRCLKCRRLLVVDLTRGTRTCPCGSRFALHPKGRHTHDLIMAGPYRSQEEARAALNELLAKASKRPRFRLLDRNA